MRTLLFLHGGLVVAFVLASCAPSGADTVVFTSDTVSMVGGGANYQVAHDDFVWDEGDES